MSYRCSLKRLSRLLVRLAFLFVGTFLSSGCEEKSPQVFQGYVEGDFVLLAAPLAGQLTTLDVQRGAQVALGEQLFTLEHRAESAAVSAAEEEVHRAESLLADLQKGQRPSELEVLRAQLEKAKVQVELSRKELERRRKLSQTRAISTEDFEQAQTAFIRDQAGLRERQAEYDTARLGARSDAIKAAQAGRDAARARLEQARWAVAQKTQRAPHAALVYDTLFEPGEYVPAGYPVVSLLPPNYIKLRFFVPEPLLGSLQLGQRISVSIEGRPAPLEAKISYISPRAEYTPPVIYSRETRAKLVFLAEARPALEDAAQLHPGQPVEVRLEPSDE